MKQQILSLNLTGPALPIQRPRTGTAPVSPARPSAGCASRLILRFQRSERLLHWSIAVPFMVCFSTGFILLVFFHLRSQQPARVALSWTHRLSGLCLLMFPLWNALRNLRDHKLHRANVREACYWTFADIKWLALMGLAAVFPSIQLPEQGKFNAAEKINFMMVMTTYPVFIATGLILVLPGTAFASWVIHVAMALMATPLMLGHIYMALINPGTRVGLSGMTSGYVDRHWAQHHYQRWYRENFEDGDSVQEALPRSSRPAASAGGQAWEKANSRAACPTA